MRARVLLHKTVSDVLYWMHKKRVQSLKAAVFSALSGRRLSVTGLGRSLRSSTQEKHNIKRADRLLGNAHLTSERLRVYSSLTRQIIGPGKRVVVLVDWADLDSKKRSFLLRAATPVGGRSLTLYEEVHSLRTREKPKTHKQFLNKLQSVLPRGCKPIVVTDAGFRTPWFREVERLGWDYVGRVRNRHQVMLNNQWYWESIKNLYKNATRVPKMYPGALLTRTNPIECNLVLFKQKKKGRIKYGKHGAPVRSSNSKKNAARAREPWLLASSLTSSSRIVKLYKTRMQIEESFRDLKSSRYGLGLEQSDTYKLERLANLVLIGSLAAIVCWIIGKAAHISRLHFQFQANSIKHKPVISLIYLGLQIIQRPNFLLDKNICGFAALALSDTVQDYARA